MNSRERVLNTLRHRAVDRPAVQYLYTPVGFYEHGEALNDVYARYPGDFGAFTRQPIPAPPPFAFDSDGRYYERITDEWGATQEYRVYGIMGHAVDWPVRTAADAANYTFPPQPKCVRNPAAYSEALRGVKRDYCAMCGGGGLLERMWTLRGFENLMMDIADDEPEINALMDRLAAYYRAQVEAVVRAGAEIIAFGDDYGTATGLLLSKEMFRQAVKPRLAYMMEPARQAGLFIHFHSCGRVLDLFDDFKDLGITSLWPQLPVYDMVELKQAIDFYGFAIAIHTDRAGTMTSGTPQDVRDAVLLENEIFKPKDGGAWFYIEADTGFPLDNIKMLTETVRKL